METLKQYWLTWVLVAAAFLAPVLIYDRLPDSVPIHWNARGEVDGWMAKPLGAFLLPLASAFVAMLSVLAPLLSPKGFEMNPMARFYPTMVATIAATMLYATVQLLRAAMGMPVAMTQHAVGIVGLLLVLIGNYLGKSTRNFFFGIRTPWTLASDEVWERTHRLAAPLTVIAGFVLLCAAVFDVASLALLFAITIIVVVAPVLQSFLLWRKLDQGQPR